MEALIILISIYVAGFALFFSTGIAVLVMRNRKFSWYVLLKIFIISFVWPWSVASAILREKPNAE